MRSRTTHENIGILYALTDLMKSENECSTNSNTVFHALAAVRTGQASFGRAYYEFRHLPEASIFAKLRLIFAVLEKSLYEQIKKEESPDFPIGDHGPQGPFAEDPRSSVFGIEASLAIDYLQRSEKKLLAWCQAEANELNLETGLLDSWKEASKELAEATRSQYTKKVDTDTVESEQSYALCG